MRSPIRNREVTRLEGFSDAIIGFAATLLVVSLEAPRTYEDLTRNLAGFIPFAISFAALVTIWAAHNNLFRRYPLADHTSVALNGLLLFTILFYVYPLKFMAAGAVRRFTGIGDVSVVSLDQLASAFVIYGAGWCVVFGSFALLYVHASRTRALELTEVERFDAVTHARHYMIFVLAGLLSIALALGGLVYSFGVPGFAYALLGPLCWWNAASRASLRSRRFGGELPERADLTSALAPESSVA